MGQMARVARVALLLAVLAGSVVAVAAVSPAQAQEVEDDAPVGAWGHAPEPTLSNGLFVHLSDDRVAVLQIRPFPSFVDQPGPTPPPQVQVYDPLVGTWSDPVATTPLAGTSSIRPIALLDGTFLAGQAIIDPDDGSHRPVDPPPWDDVNHQPVLLDDGRLLVSGGCCSANDSIGHTLIFDPGSGTWEEVAPMAGAREAHGSVRLADGRVLVAGGSFLSSVTNTAEIYDPEADAWAPAAPMTYARYAPKLFLLQDGRVVAAAGSHVPGSCGIWDVYDPTEDVWTPTTRASSCADSALGVAQLRDDRILSIAAGFPDDVQELYDPATDSWRRTALPRVSRWYNQIFVFDDGRALVWGGPPAPGPHRPGTSTELFYPGPSAPPAPASAVVAEDDEPADRVSWQASPTAGVVAYRVYRAHGHHPLRLVGVVPAPATQLLDRPPTTSNGYHYAVTAMGLHGESALALEQPGPFPWSNGTLAALVVDGRVELTWSMRVDGDDRPTRFYVFRGPHPSTPIADIAAPDTGEAGVLRMTHRETDPVPTTDTFYEVRVTLQSGAVEHVASTLVQAPRPPDAPNVTAQRTGSSITAGWTAPSPGTSPISGYDVELDGEVVGRTGPEIRSVTLDAPDRTVAHTVRVAAVSAVGRGTWGSASVPASAVAPAAPTLTGSRSPAGVVTLQWQKPDDGGTAITGYEIERTDENGAVVALSAGADATTFTDRGTDPELAYTYRVAAVNAVGRGAWSTTVDLAATRWPPYPPVDVTATALDRRATVTWTQPAPSAHPGAVSYVVTASPGGASTTVDGAATRATVTGLTNGQRYTFSVHGVDAAGDSGSESLPSNAVVPAPQPCTLIGTTGNDILVGTPGRDVICGLDGNDTIRPGGGDDDVIGGTGVDTVSFSNVAGPVEVDLTAGTATRNGLAILSGIENAAGSPGDDRLRGDGTANLLDGLGGRDVLASTAGDDRYVGGTGVDELTFVHAPAGVTVDLTAGTATGHGTDTIAGVENATGSQHADRIIGSGQPNRLVGGGGDDALSGMAGNDALDGSAAGDDLCVQGTGSGLLAGCERTALPLTVNDLAKPEGNANSPAHVVVTAPVPTDMAIPLTAATASGTATSPADFTARSGSITFQASKTSWSVPVTVVGDRLDEADETFTLALSRAPSFVELRRAAGTVTIVDDDASPSLSIADVRIVEGTGGSTNAFLPVRLSAPSGQTVRTRVWTVSRTATDGADYRYTDTILEFGPGEVSRTVVVPITTDSDVERDEQLAVQLISPVHASIADGEAVVTIADDDIGISVGDVYIHEGDARTKTVLWPITLSTASTKNVTVRYATVDGTATAPEDYVAKAPTAVTIKAGSTVAWVPIVVRGDNVAEPTETFGLVLSSPVNAVIVDGTGVAQFTDDDAPPASVATFT